MTTYVISLYRKKKPLEAFINFFENVMKNPSESSRNELYDFMQATKLPITNRGTFLAYRSIRRDWLDQHSGKMDNHLGKIIEMPRDKVNSNRNETCSAGLHFAGQQYNAGWAYNKNGTWLTIIEIHPKDVVSIPTDYNNHKGRCCKFKVLDVALNDKALEDLWFFSPQVATKEVFINRIKKTKWGKTLTKAALNKFSREELVVQWMDAIDAEK